MKIAFLGLTITSAWGNGHATTYRSLCSALYRRGHKVVFLEKDLKWYRESRDLASPSYCEVTLYKEWSEAVRWIRRHSDADAVVLGSYFPDGIAAADYLAEVARCPVLFYDIDTPVTLAGMRQQGGMPYLKLSQIPQFDAYLSFTGGPVLEEICSCFGAQRSAALYCSVDPELHFRRSRQARFKCDLSYLGTYAADRQQKLDLLLNRVALALPDSRFIVAGPLYPEDIRWANNVERIEHVAPPDHSSFYSSSRFTLNLTRQDMVGAGYSPSVRLFEAAACGAAIISDYWPGLEEFFKPGNEILLAATSEEVVRYLNEITDSQAAQLGAAARERVLERHTSMHRAAELEAAIALCLEPLVYR